MHRASPRNATLYDILMVAEHADQEIIGVVRRALAKRYHPDVERSPEAARRMAEINSAYHVLGDPERRARYDAELAASRGHRPAEVESDSRPTHASRARPPSGRQEGSVIDFGRYSGWSLGEIARHDRDFLEWLMRAPAGRQYRDEIRTLLSRRS